MRLKFVLKGGTGSGNFDHAGRPGKIGGSSPGGGAGGAKFVPIHERPQMSMFQRQDTAIALEKRGGDYNTVKRYLETADVPWHDGMDKIQAHFEAWKASGKTTPKAGTSRTKATTRKLLSTHAQDSIIHNIPDGSNVSLSEARSRLRSAVSSYTNHVMENNPDISDEDLLTNFEMYVDNTEILR